MFMSGRDLPQLRIKQRSAKLERVYLILEVVALRYTKFIPFINAPHTFLNIKLFFLVNVISRSPTFFPGKL